MENKKTIIGLSIALIAILIIGLGLTGFSTKNNEDTIKIGVIGTLTGVGQYVGEQEIRALELAKEDINNAGGINGKKIELIVEDSGTSPAKAVNAFKKLSEVDGVDFIIGDSWSSTTVAIVPLANQNEVIMISPVAILDELSEDDMFFRTVPTTDELMKVLADYTYNDLGSRKVGVILQNTPFGTEHTEDFEKYFEELGGEVVSKEKVELTQVDVSSELIKINSKNPDTILNLHAAGPMLGVPLKQAKELNINVNWISSIGSENALLVKDYPELSDGMLYPYFYNSDSSNQAVEEFSDKFYKRYGTRPSFIAANAYDCLGVLAEAIEKSSEDPLDVKESLLRINNYQGASGTFSFDKNGDVTKPIFMKQIRNTEFRKINTQ